MQSASSRYYPTFRFTTEHLCTSIEGNVRVCVCVQDTPPGPALANGAPWILLSVSLLLMSLSSAAVAPFSKWITYLYVVLPTLGLSVGAAALVLAMGKKVTSRPRLRPDQVEPWLPENGGASTSAAAGAANEPLLSHSAVKKAA